jgi:hypothetical protein
MIFSVVLALLELFYFCAVGQATPPPRLTCPWPASNNPCPVESDVVKAITPATDDAGSCFTTSGPDEKFLTVSFTNVFADAPGTTRFLAVAPNESGCDFSKRLFFRVEGGSNVRNQNYDLWFFPLFLKFILVLAISCGEGGTSRFSPATPSHAAVIINHAIHAYCFCPKLDPFAGDFRSGTWTS